MMNGRDSAHDQRKPPRQLINSILILFYSILFFLKHLAFQKMLLAEVEIPVQIE